MNCTKSTRRGLLTVSGSLILGGSLGNTASSEKSTSNSEGKNASLSKLVVNAPLPDNPSMSTYARLGRKKQTTVVYYGSWKCPYCAQFSTGLLEEILKDYVEPRKINLEFRALAYSGANHFSARMHHVPRAVDSLSGALTPIPTGSSMSTSSPINQQKISSGLRPTD